MFKKLHFKGLNYSDLDRYEKHDIKRDEMHSFYQTFDFLDLIKSWPEIVGEKYAKITAPLKIKNGCLFIVVIHPNVSHEMTYFSEILKSKIAKSFPKLKSILQSISYITQEGFFNQHRPSMGKETTLAKKIHPQSPQYKILKLEAEKLFEEIPDQELKEIMISIYIQSK